MMLENRMNNLIRDYFKYIGSFLLWFIVSTEALIAHTE